jgi:hypothetical protein
MATREPNDLIERCLAAAREEAQREGLTDEGDRAFAALFRAVDVPTPGDDFASRAVRAARLAPLPVGRRALLSRSTRAAQYSAGALVLLAGAAAAALVFEPLVTGVLAAYVSALVTTGFSMIQLVKGGVDMWTWWAEAGRVLTVLLQTGAGATALALTALVGLLGVIGLERLVRSEEESFPC